MHSTNLGKPAPNLSFVARPEKPTVVVAAEEKVRGAKEEEKKTPDGGGGGVGVGGVSGGSSIGWSSDVLRGRASGAERVESTNAEFTNGTETKESQEVALKLFHLSNHHVGLAITLTFRGAITADATPQEKTTSRPILFP